MSVRKVGKGDFFLETKTVKRYSQVDNNLPRHVQYKGMQMHAPLDSSCTFGGPSTEIFTHLHVFL